MKCFSGFNLGRKPQPLRPTLILRYEQQKSKITIVLLITVSIEIFSDHSSSGKTFLQTVPIRFQLVEKSRKSHQIALAGENLSVNERVVRYTHPFKSFQQAGKLCVIFHSDSPLSYLLPPYPTNSPAPQPATAPAAPTLSPAHPTTPARIVPTRYRPATRV